MHLQRQRRPASYLARLRSALPEEALNSRDDEINAYAVPQLRSEVLTAQSASIDAVSGATVTSGGYVESLQAALDAAHFG